MGVLPPERDCARLTNQRFVPSGKNLTPTALRQAQCKHGIIRNMWHVYMLLCDQKTFYVGISDDPRERLKNHRTNKSLFTKKFSDIEFVYCEHWPSKYDAAIRERQLKGWSRAKKQMLIDGKLGYNVCTGLVEVLSQMDDLP